MKEDRIPRDETRKDQYEDEAFQDEPNRGAWTGGWQDLPGRRSWLQLAIEARTAQPAPAHAPSGDRSDDAIRADLERALKKVPDVSAEVIEGTVALAGRVASQAKKLEAQRLAGRVPGIRALYNHVAVKRAA